MVSGDGTAPLHINQDAFIYAGSLAKGAIINHPIKHQVYILVSQGEIEIEGKTIKTGAGVEISDSKSVSIKALAQCEVLLIDAPLE
jgi:redox-sensitive bicupin YhaK (pirin superfamily)